MRRSGPRLGGEAGEAGKAGPSVVVPSQSERHRLKATTRAQGPWAATRPAAERVALDPYRGYYNALVGGLDAPEVVVDAFHIVRLGNVMVDEPPAGAARNDGPPRPP